MKRLIFAALLATPAAAHDEVVHKTPEEARQHAAQTQTPAPAPEGLPLPFDLGGAFTLTDQHGAARTEADPDGALQMVFFGYANCPSICAVALPLMGEVTDALRDQGVAVTPVMVTVDPERDTVETIGPPLAQFHEDFVGLTGVEADLQAVYDLFNVEKEVVFEDPEYGPIFAHGSHIYLLDGEGTFLTLLPPILSADRLSEIAAAYQGS